MASDTDTIQGFTKAGLEQFNAKFHALVDDGKLANVVTLISRHGEIVNCDAYGVMDISATPHKPVQTDTIYRIASMTKPITSAAMMMLWEDGKWAFEDPVSKFIPEFEDLKVKQEDGELVPQTSPMNMKQLLSHTAGFGARWEYEDLRTGDLQDMVDFLAKQPLFFQPGKDWRYGPSIDLCGYIIQKLTGQYLDEFLVDRLFKPMGMVDSGYILPESKVERLVHTHKHEDGKLAPIDLEGSYNPSRPKFLGGGGGYMLSTVKDYWRFCQMILNGGEFEGKRYLKQSTVDMMHTNVLEPGVKISLRGPGLPGVGFGLGYAIDEDPSVLKTGLGINSFYWGGLYGTWFWIDPVNDMIVVGFINNTGSGLAGPAVVRYLSATLVYGAMKDSS